LHLDIGRLNEFAQAVEDDPEKAKFTFAAKTTWRDGAVTATRAREHVIAADEPEVLGGTDSAADPVELLLASLASCVSIGLVTQAAKRGVEIRDFEIEVEGELDVRGYLGYEDVRPGFTAVRYTLKVDSDAPAGVLEEIVKTVERTSPMFDNISNGVPVSSRLEVVAPT
jgi:uncharacterized OsmC-like protein